MCKQCTFVNEAPERVDLNEEVVLEEDEANNREEVDEDDSEDSCQQNGPSVLCHRPDHCEQRLHPVHDVQQLGGQVKQVWNSTSELLCRAVSSRVCTVWLYMVCHGTQG